MSCCGGNTSCAPRTEVLAELDFTTSGWCEKYFRFALGTDGVAVATPEGLVINSKEFTVTPTDPSKGLFDNFKFNVYYHLPIYTKRHHEIILTTTAAAKQYFKTSAPFPDVFAKRIRNIFADPRLAHAQVSFIDPDHGIIAGWAITDQQLYGLYGRLPLAEDNSWCQWSEPGARECRPCADACPVAYNCNNFQEDCRYIQFKQHASFWEYCRFVHFIKWADYCDNASYDLFNWDLFIGYRNQYPVGDGLFEASWATWKAWNDWVEYQYFMRFYQWEQQEKVWSAGCGPDGCTVIAPCGGNCAKKALENAKCHHVYNGGDNCYAAAVNAVAAAAGNLELYPYQFGTKRCCTCYDYATFIDLIPLQTRGACDPLCDFAKLGVGIDACASQINWYINQRLVFTHVGIGLRLGEQYRVRENGGYSEQVYVRRVLVDFGTGSLLDASLPNNYDRYRAKDDYVDMTALVPLQDDLTNSSSKTNYFQLYNNKLGGLLPVNRSETFAVVSSDPAYRVFGQGDILKIKNIIVTQRRTFNAYKIPTTICLPFCATCNNKPGYCGYDYEEDCENDPWCADCVDPRDFTIEQLPGVAQDYFGGSYAPINQLQYALGNNANSAGFGGASGTRDVTGSNNQGGTVSYVLTRRPESKRYYEQKFPVSTGVSPYL